MPSKRTRSASGLPDPNAAPVPRQRPVSCQFCRSRKLRCSRTIPCTNCSARNIHCGLDVPAAASAASTAPPPELPNPTQEDILKRLRRLEDIVLQRDESQNKHDQSPSANPEQLSPAAADLCLPLVDSAAPRAAATVTSRAHNSPLDELVGDGVYYLETMSRVENYEYQAYAGSVVLKTTFLRNLPSAPEYLSQSQTKSIFQPTRCLWFPHHQEARQLVEMYINSLGGIHHVVHFPSLLQQLDSIYYQLEKDGPPQIGHLILFFAVFSSAAYAWTPQPGASSLFSSLAEATNQSLQWARAAQDLVQLLLNSFRESTTHLLEAVQGMVILSFTIGMQQNVGLRFRSLISNALLVGREIGLHRWDHPTADPNMSLIQKETGRRVWWYLAATDWLLAARYGGQSEGTYQCDPRRMMVHKPRNINDADLIDGTNERPPSEPTEMSYFLQRIRLAEIARSIVDRSPISATQTTTRSYEHIQYLDTELENMLGGLPEFLHLNEKSTTSAALDSNITVQAYCINSLLNTQRCRLHLPYMKCSLLDSAYSYSHGACLKAARRLIEIELQLEKTNHSFVKMRLKSPSMLYGVFIAGIALITQICAKEQMADQDALRRDMAEALRIIQSARGQCIAAETLFKSLNQLLRKHQIILPRARQHINDGTARLPNICHEPQSIAVQPFTPDSLDRHIEEQENAPSDAFNSSLSATNECSNVGGMPHGLDGWMDFEHAGWDKLFASLDSSWSM